jgi:hypothetical protein
MSCTIMRYGFIAGFIAISLHNGTACQFHTMVFDEKGRTVLLFGGSSGQDGQYHNPDDMWICQNALWTTHQPVRE